MAFFKKIMLFSPLTLLYHTLCVLASSFPTTDSTPICDHSKVLILGAGMAGISAGKNLTLNGIDDFKIIEYQDRIGGRTLHTSFGEASDGSSYTVELGTNWITGLRRHNGSKSTQGLVNPIWILADEVNLTTVSTIGGQLTYNHNGLYDWLGEINGFLRTNNKLWIDADNRVRHAKPDISVRAALRLNGWDPTNEMLKQAAEWIIWDADAATTPDLSSHIFSELNDEASEGALLGPFSRLVLDQRGYDTVIKYLASEYLEPSDDRLVLSSPIKNIIYSASGVTVHTVNNTCYTGDYAMCTFSLGVLQQALNGRAPVKFTPPLPAWKQESIATNVMGIYTKIFFQFDHVFWPKDIQNFYFASPTTRGYWRLWESLDFPGSPLEGSGIIFATMVWEQSMRLEQQTDEETMGQGLAVLRLMFPNVTIPQPRDFLYPRWGMTPWAYGSYSNWAVGYTLQEHTNYRANVERLWFAGEAGSSEDWGYLHGAYYEGEMAADEIAPCVKGLSSCHDRKRYTDLRGQPEKNYNHTSGFQNRIQRMVNQDK